MAMWGGGGEWEAEAAGHTALRNTRTAAAAAMPDYELRKALNFEVYPTRGPSDDEGQLEIYCIY